VLEGFWGPTPLLSEDDPTEFGSLEVLEGFGGPSPLLSEEYSGPNKLTYLFMKILLVDFIRLL
jgi:hypothetical protein